MPNHYKKRLAVLNKSSLLLMNYLQNPWQLQFVNQQRYTKEDFYFQAVWAWVNLRVINYVRFLFTGVMLSSSGSGALPTKVDLKTLITYMIRTPRPKK
jgi:hypothetical protein